MVTNFWERQRTIFRSAAPIAQCQPHESSTQKKKYAPRALTFYLPSGCVTSRVYQVRVLPRTLASVGQALGELLDPGSGPALGKEIAQNLLANASKVRLRFGWGFITTYCLSLASLCATSCQSVDAEGSVGGLPHWSNHLI